MLWSHLRGHASSDSGESLRRYSTVDQSQLERSSEYVRDNVQDSQSDARPAVEPSYPSYSSIEQADAVDGADDSQGSSSPAVQDQLLRPRRFSRLKFRHASDSQLSRTAKDQASMNPPPLPVGKLVTSRWRSRSAPKFLLTMIFFSTLHHHHSTNRRSVRHDREKKINILPSPPS